MSSKADQFESFSEELKVKTQSVHDKADKFVSFKLAIALTDTKLYAGVLRDFYTVYETIESQVQKHLNNDLVNAMWLPEMARTPGFEEDLNFFLGETKVNLYNSST